MKDKIYKYRVGYLYGGKIREMFVKAASMEHAREKWQRFIDDKQAFTESGSKPYRILSIRQYHFNNPPKFQPES